MPLARAQTPPPHARHVSLPPPSRPFCALTLRPRVQVPATGGHGAALSVSPVPAPAGLRPPDSPHPSDEDMALAIHPEGGDGLAAGGWQKTLAGRKTAYT